MADTAFGPQGPNYTTVRPATDPLASTLHTWFKPCSAPNTRDGTMVTASWLNVVTGNLRELVISAGITLDDTSDTMIRDAVAKMIADAGGAGFTSSPITVI